MVKIRRGSPRMRYYKRYTEQYVRDHFLILALGCVFLFGVWMGTQLLSAGGGELGDSLGILLSGFLQVRTGQSINHTLVATFFSSFLLLFFVFISGFSAISIPVILLVPLFKGIGFGLSAASLVSQYGTTGVAYLGFLMLPNAVISGVALLYACQEALSLSKKILFALKGENPQGGYGIPVYCVRMLFLVGILAIGAALEGVLFAMFSGYFTF